MLRPRSIIAAAQSCTGQPQNVTGASWPDCGSSSVNCTAICNVITGYVDGDDGPPTLTCSTDGLWANMSDSLIGSCLQGMAP